MRDIAPSIRLQFPQTPEVMTYDSDGNLTSDGIWDYTYDAKNRLVGMESKTVVSQDGYFILIDYVYDYLGRRSEKVVQRHEGALVNLATVYTEKYLYNGWNVVAVIHDADSPGGATDVMGYTWGLDLSGTLDGAGGVGGLLAIEDGRTGGTYSIIQDGNGNVAAVVDLSSRAVVAEFEYAPYGQVIREAGSYAGKMPFRFSTKWFDANTDLYYYGFRFYDPENGRFINRDPIGEDGGVNLYAFVGNDPQNAFDLLGLDIYYLYDRDFLRGKAGHSAIVVGGNGEPWQYRSKSPGNNLLAGSREDNIDIATPLPASWSFEKVMSYINKYNREGKASAYDSAFGVSTTEKQDYEALNWLDNIAPSGYFLIGGNCDDYVVGAFNEAGIDLKKGFLPSKTFKKALENIRPNFKYARLPGADYFNRRNPRRNRISFTQAYWAMRDNMKYIDNLSNNKLFEISHPGWANLFDLMQRNTWVSRTRNGRLKIDQTEGMWDPSARTRLQYTQLMKTYYSNNKP